MVTFTCNNLWDVLRQNYFGNKTVHQIIQDLFKVKAFSIFSTIFTLFYVNANKKGNNYNIVLSIVTSVCMLVIESQHNLSHTSPTVAGVHPA